MQAPPDYYLQLGLPRDATSEEIRRAYFDAARRLHPDRNISPGETEIFLDVQKAYEILADPDKRRQYDASLPPEEQIQAPVLQKITYSRRSIPRMQEPQLFYILMEYSQLPDAGQPLSPSLNLCLVLDRSTSMQGKNMDTVKTTAIQILRRMRPQDILSVISFSDRAEVIIPATHITEQGKLEARIQMLRNSGSTEIFQGLEAGFNEVLHNYNPSLINHIILVTDGRTYGDEKRCYELAGRASHQGIGISGLGIGHEWNDVFLDNLASETGGSSFYVSQPNEIEKFMLEKFNHLTQVYAEDITLNYKLDPHVQLRYAFRLLPEAGALSIESPMRLGPLLRKNQLTMLMEFLIEPEATKKSVLSLINGKLELSISSQGKVVPPIQLNLTRSCSETGSPDTPPQGIVQALSRLTLYRIQEQARLEVSAGQYNRASKHLQQLASHLVDQGERGLARTVLLEADNIQKNKRFSMEGDKQIKYGTRALLTAGKEKEQ